MEKRKKVIIIIIILQSQYFFERNKERDKKSKNEILGNVSLRENRDLDNKITQTKLAILISKLSLVARIYQNAHTQFKGEL